VLYKLIRLYQRSLRIQAIVRLGVLLHHVIFKPKTKPCSYDKCSEHFAAEAKVKGWRAFPAIVAAMATCGPPMLSVAGGDHCLPKASAGGGEWCAPKPGDCVGTGTGVESMEWCIRAGVSCGSLCKTIMSPQRGGDWPEKCK
jgi:hypothetical protein